LDGILYFFVFNFPLLCRPFVPYLSLSGFHKFSLCFLLYSPLFIRYFHLCLIPYFYVLDGILFFFVFNFPLLCRPFVPYPSLSGFHKFSLCFLLYSPLFIRYYHLCLIPYLLIFFISF
jgi:hypothetical protein